MPRETGCCANATKQTARQKAKAEADSNLRSILIGFLLTDGLLGLYLNGEGYTRDGRLVLVQFEFSASNVLFALSTRCGRDACGPCEELVWSRAGNY